MASSAAISVMTLRLAKAIMNRHPGLKDASEESCDFSEMDGTFCEEAESWLGVDEGKSSLDSSLKDRTEGVDMADQPR